MRLNDKRALILGGGGAGIGRAVTRAYAAAGASIVVADIDSAGAESAAVEVRDAGAAGHARRRRPLRD
jgi:3-oxoacyl-[acyl-carrier protein] reductase